MQLSMMLNISLMAITQIPNTQLTLSEQLLLEEHIELCCAIQMAAVCLMRFEKQRRRQPIRLMRRLEFTVTTTVSWLLPIHSPASTQAQYMYREQSMVMVNVAAMPTCVP